MPKGESETPALTLGENFNCGPVAGKAPIAHIVAGIKEEKKMVCDMIEQVPTYLPHNVFIEPLASGVERVVNTIRGSIQVDVGILRQKGVGASAKEAIAYAHGVGSHKVRIQHPACDRPGIG